MAARGFDRCSRNSSRRFPNRSSSSHGRPRRAAPTVRSEDRISYNTGVVLTNFDRYQTLTAREREVLHLAAKDLTSAEIATRLGISVQTAETDRSTVMQKLDLHTHADLVRFALRSGIVTMEE